MTPEQQAEMFAKIAAFASRFGRDSVRPLLKDWDRRIILVEEEEQQSLAITIRDGQLVDMAAAETGAASETDIVIRGKRDDLMGLLDGSLSPGQAVLEERILVSAQPEDQIKLDALSFALWDD